MGHLSNAPSSDNLKNKHKVMGAPLSKLLDESQWS